MNQGGVDVKSAEQAKAAPSHASAAMAAAELPPEHDPLNQLQSAKMTRQMLKEHRKLQKKDEAFDDAMED